MELTFEPKVSVMLNYFYVLQFCGLLLPKLEAKKLKTPATDPNLEKQLASEMSSYDKIDQKGMILQKVLLSTQTIRPNSCYCNRVFFRLLAIFVPICVPNCLMKV